MDLIERQIAEGFYCFDTKPANFVVNLETSTESIDVKMIDFDTNFCKENKIYTNNENDELVPFGDGLTFKDLFYIISAIQMYLLTNMPIFYSDYFSHPLCTKFFKCNWEKIIMSIIENAVINQQNGERDPSNNFVHYSCFLFRLDKKLVYTDNEAAEYLAHIITGKLSN
jgi:hypothetical protein